MPLSLPRLLHHLHLLAAPSEPASDVLLLSRFIRDRDESAFAALVSRHGPMVLNVCRRLLGDAHAAEDAFQATFLILARKAPSLSRPDALAGWLYGVASRVASRARSSNARAHIRQRIDEEREPIDPRPDPLAQLTARELLGVLEEELQRLPPAYRLPVVLCCLEGHSQEEAARRLGWTPGSVKGRLERGRRRLHDRLQRRGVSLSAALGLAEVARGAGPTASLLARTGEATLLFAAGRALPAALISHRALTLAQKGLQPMWMTRSIGTLVVLLLAGGLAAGLGLTARQAPTPAPTTRSAAPTEEVASGPARIDRYGDGLPDKAVARLGTVRWRHPGEAYELAFSPNGKTLVAVCSDEVMLWDTASGKTIHRWKRDELRPTPSGKPILDRLNAPNFTSDGRTLIFQTDDGKICLLDPATGNAVRTFSGPSARGREAALASLSSDDKLLAVVSDVDKVAIVDLATTRVLQHFGGHRAAIYGLAFSPDGKTLAVGTLNPSVQLWEVGTGKMLWGNRYRDSTAKERDSFVTAVAFSPDGKTLAAGRWDHITLLEAATGKDLGRLEYKTMQSCNGLTFTPDGKTLVSGSQDCKIRVWDLETKKERRTFDGRMWIGRSMALSRDGRTVAIGTVYNAIRLWDVGTGRELFTDFEGHDAPINCVAFSLDGRVLVTGGDNGQTRLWDTSSWKPTHRLEASSRSLSFTPEGNRLATVAYNKTVRIWDFARLSEAAKFELPDTDDLSQACFDREGKTLLSLDRKRPERKQGSEGFYRLVVWDPSAGKRLRELTVTELRPHTLALLPDGRTVVLGSDDGLIHQYDLKEGKVLLTLEGHRPRWPVTSLALSADGRTLLSGSADSAARLWDLVSGREIRVLDGHRRGVSVVAFSPDGRLAASAGHATGYYYEAEDPRRILLWDVATGQRLVQFEGHVSDVTSLAFSPDGTRLVSGHRDSTALVWDLASLPKLPALRANADQLDALWEDLAGKDAWKAHQAVWRLASSPEHSVPFSRTHVSPAAEVDPKRLARLLADLESDTFAVRSAAAEELEKIGDQAAPVLRTVLAKKPSLELRRRAEQLLRGMHPVASPERLRRIRAVQVLERIGSPGAREVLEKIASGAPAARETREAKDALGRLARKR
jgi:RNA polymerase sigma factor (sigma-70 family)